MREVKKVLIVTNVPQDYRIAMFNALHLLLQQENIQFKVAFGAAGYKRRKSKLDFNKMKFDYTILKSTKFTFGSTENTMSTYRDWETDRKSTRLNSSHSAKSRMPSSA